MFSLFRANKVNEICEKTNAVWLKLHLLLNDNTVGSVGVEYAVEVVYLVLKYHRHKTLNVLLAGLESGGVVVGDGNSLRAPYFAPAIGHRKAPLATRGELLAVMGYLWIDIDLKGLCRFVKPLNHNHSTQYAHLWCSNAYALILGVIDTLNHRCHQPAKFGRKKFPFGEWGRGGTKSERVGGTFDAQNTHSRVVGAIDYRPLLGAPSATAAPHKEEQKERYCKTETHLVFGFWTLLGKCTKRLQKVLSLPCKK